MASVETLEKELVESQTAVTVQGDTVRSLKAALKDGKAKKVCPEHVRLEEFKRFSRCLIITD